MNWDFPANKKSYVDIAPPTPTYSPDPARGAAFWPTPGTETGLGIVFPQDFTTFDHHPIIGPFGGPLKPPLHEELFLQSCDSSGVPAGSYPCATDPYPGSAHTVHHPVNPLKTLGSTPCLEQPNYCEVQQILTPASSIHTPQRSAPLPARQLSYLAPAPTMADPRRASVSGQRPMMGPPETPSRMMGASPNLFPTLQFSPDMFQVQQSGPMSAPAYPQQRLFWDQSTPPQTFDPVDQFSSSFQPQFDAPFDSAVTNTTIPAFSPIVIPPEQQYELPAHPMSAGPTFMDTNPFPAPFHTSPRVLPPQTENPTLFLSSPARRFERTEASSKRYTKKTIRNVPAYHHQIEEARREVASERKRRSRTAKKEREEMIMSSVRRALSPTKVVRPGLKRSNTHSGASAASSSQPRRQHRVAFNDSASASSATSDASSRAGRSSPRKQAALPALRPARPSQKPRPGMNLAIDEHGVAKIEEVDESDEMDMDASDDSEADSFASSRDGADFEILPSQRNSFAVDDDDFVASQGTITNPQTALRLNGIGRHGFISKPNRQPIPTFLKPDLRADETIRASKRSSLHADTAAPATGKGDAQKALLAMMQERSRSASSQGTQDYPTSRPPQGQMASQTHPDMSSSGQFHSSPPVQQSQFGVYNASPTTVTDPDLADLTPSTDHEFFPPGSGGRGPVSSQSPLAHKSRTGRAK